MNLASSAGRTLNFEWFDPAAGRVVSSGTVQGGNGSQSFATPAGFAGDSVLCIVDAAGHGG